MLRLLSYIVRDYFGFSRTETRGLLLLLSLVVLAVGASVAYDRYEVTYHQLPQDQEVLQGLLQQLEARAEYTSEEKNIDDEAIAVRKFNFDPNTAAVESLSQLGIPDFLAKRIEKYRNKGGSFSKAEDLKKIYGFPDDLYHELAPFIQIARKSKPIQKDRQLPEKLETIAKTEDQPEDAAVTEEAIRLNINATDSLALEQLSGIGKVISSRIIKYRDRLGGIHSIEQLQEVYHISEEAMASLRSSAFVEENFEAQKININEADFKSLMAHPYISYEMAKGIMNHRRIYGSFTSAEQLKEVYQIKEESLVKLLPYLVI